MIVQTTPETERRRRQAALAVFTFVQAVAAIFFLSDAVADLIEGYVDFHTIFEFFIALGLLFGSVFGVREIRRIHARLSSHERALAAASGALNEVIETQFTDWGLTPAERDVAMLALKGMENAEIAEMRGAASGTVRAQMTSVYIKAGVGSRAQFAAFFVEDLLVSGVRPTGSG